MIPPRRTARRGRLPALLASALAVVAAGTLAVAACVPRSPREAPAAAPPPAVLVAASAADAASGKQGAPRERVVRVALATALPSAAVSATAAWQVAEEGGATVLVRGAGGERWRIQQRGGLLRVAGDGGDRTPWRPGPFVARPAAGGGFVQYDGRRYRGELWFLPTADGVAVVNRLPMEAYLRGVVPLELGTRAPGDRAALEAQAIAARSFAMVRVPRDAARDARRGWHLRAGVADQAYGGVEAEYPLADAAVAATAGLVLRFAGRIVTAPYSAACGGRTAAPGEAWDGVAEAPFLRPVDDHDPATGRAYCDIAPASRWTRELDATVLSDAVRRVLAREAAQGEGSAGAAAWVPVHDVRVASRGRSGRIGTLVLATDRGEVRVRAATLRAWLRTSRRASLASTAFAVEGATHAEGRVASIRLRGVGHGHGVGMCQWGAIGRARAGQDARTILQHYYPGTVVGAAD